MKVVILAGGNGTRLWPISRETFPKQFNKLDILDGKSLFQKSLQRALKLTKLENIYVIVSKQNYFHAEVQAEEEGISLPKENFILQPSMKETLPIISLSVKKIGDENIIFLPSDHVIGSEEIFKQKVEFGIQQKIDGIIVFGIRPDKPETGYGYIKKQDKKSDFSKVDRFFEKPSKEKANEFIEKGYLWNSGITLINGKNFKELLLKNKPEMKELVFDSNFSDDEIFDRIEAVSIENGLIEKIDNVYCVDIDNYWTDLGNFDSIDEYSIKNNIVNKNIINEGKSKNNFVLTDTKDKEVCLIDIENLVIVDTEDVLLISKKGSTQKVKNIVKKSTKNIGNLEYRPWGSYKIISKGRGYKTKSVLVLPGKKLSLQMHHHRSEHWVIAEGTGRVTIDDKQTILSKGQSIYIPIGSRHRLENPGLIPLKIIETQIGVYLEEDDIERYEDDFGRL